MHPGIQKLSVAHAAGSGDALWLASASGELRRLDAERLSAPVKVFEERLLGLCCVGAPGSCRAKGLEDQGLKT